MTAFNPGQMRALADAVDWPGIPGQPNTATPTNLSDAALALRAAAEKLEAVEGMLQMSEPGDPYLYDPWSDESVDPTNTEDVVHAAIAAGRDKGAYELAQRVRAVLEGNAQ